MPTYEGARAFRVVRWAWGGLALTLVGRVPLAHAQRQAVGTPSLVFDHVTVIDMEQGKLVPTQRVVIAGNRIQAVGSPAAVPLPRGAQIVDARGKYLIPGLWDVHTHPARYGDILYPLFLANGVTGIRDASSPLPLDTLIQMRREILAGTRIGPPRQLLTGAALDGPITDGCIREAMPHLCVADSADARHVVDSLQAVGVDMLKMYNLTPDMYFFIAAEARRKGIPFGGHAANVAAGDAADSGASIIDHINSSGGLEQRCWGSLGTLEQCQPLGERFRRHNTWFAPTLTMISAAMPGSRDISLHSDSVSARLSRATENYWAGRLPHGNWFHDTATAPVSVSSPIPTYEVVDSSRFAPVMQLAERVGLPILAGTDATPALTLSRMAAGFALHAELAMFVAEGLTPLRALQSATINPAKMLRGTDSLGTVAPGKLADLVLLDANPLQDITNTTTIRAVVANGRYFDRTALDRILAAVQERVERDPPAFAGQFGVE